MDIGFTNFLSNTCDVFTYSRDTNSGHFESNLSHSPSPPNIHPNICQVTAVLAEGFHSHLGTNAALAGKVQLGYNLCIEHTWVS